MMFWRRVMDIFNLSYTRFISYKTHVFGDLKSENEKWLLALTTKRTPGKITNIHNTKISWCKQKKVNASCCAHSSYYYCFLNIIFIILFTYLCFCSHKTLFSSLSETDWRRNHHKQNSSKNLINLNLKMICLLIYLQTTCFCLFCPYCYFLE